MLQHAEARHFRAEALVEALAPGRSLQLRFEAVGVVLDDQLIGGIEQVLPRAVVQGEDRRLGLRVRVEQRHEVRRLRAAEAVDALIVIADHGEIPALAREQPQHLELRVIGVLELVDQDPFVPIAELPQHVRPLAQDAQGDRQLIAEVEAAVPQHQLAIAGVGLRLLDFAFRLVARGVTSCSA